MRKEIWETLGISKPTFYLYVKQGKIKATKHPLTNRIHVDESEVERLRRKVAAAK